MNILLVSEVYLPTVSGVASSTDSIARFMAGRGHHVYLVCPAPLVPFDAPAQNGLDIIYTPRFSDPFLVNKPMTVIPWGIWEIWRTVIRHHIDVVHIQEPGALGNMTLVLAKLYGIPTVGAMHFSMEQVVRMTPAIMQPLIVFFMRLYIRILYPRYTAIMMPTKTVTKDLAAIIGHPERIHAISNGVDTKLYAPSERREAKRGHASYFYLGRLDKDKNIETIIRALSHTPADIQLTIAGVGTEQKHLEDVANALSVSPRVTWIAKVSLQKILDLYHAADGFIIMSPVETQSIVALQAIACGLPLIAADAGALPELVQDGKSGYLIPTFNEKMLAEKMTYLADHPDVRTRMGKESRRLSLHHEKRNVLKELEQLYKAIPRA